jgi:hypothetical protein
MIKSIEQETAFPSDFSHHLFVRCMSDSFVVFMYQSLTASTCP